MGAHSAGKKPHHVRLDSRAHEVGNFCNRAAGMIHLAVGISRQRVCHSGSARQLFREKGYPDKVAPYWRYHHANDRKKGNYKTGYRTGSQTEVWDHTPHKLDNQYYKLMRDEDFSGKDNCCGKIKGTGCHRWNARQSQDEKEI